MLKNRNLWLLVLVILAVSFIAGTEVTFAAQPVRLELQLPSEGKIGNDTLVEAVLTQSDGIPIDNMEIQFVTIAQFANVNGEVEIGRSKTDDQGIASFTYSPRAMGEQSIIARFTGSDEYEAIETPGKIIIQPGPQLQVEGAGISVPGVGVWIFALAVGVVWGIFFGIMVLLELIARKGTNIPHKEANHE